MNKEEFLLMVDSVLDELKQEKTDAESRIAFYKVAKIESSDVDKAQHELKIVDTKINRFSLMLLFPAYVAIQRMDDARVEKYKQDKIKEISDNVKRLEAEKTAAEERAKQLEIESLSLASSYSKLSPDEINQAIARAKQIEIEINRLNLPSGIINSKAKDIEAANKKMKAISETTLEEIKKGIASKIDSENRLGSLYNNRDQVTDHERMQAAISGDLLRSRKAANALTDYRSIDNEYYKGRVFLPNNTPKALEARLSDGWGSPWDKDSHTVLNFDKAFETIDEFEADFKQKKEEFIGRFTLDNIAGLARDWRNVTEVDLVFLKRNKDIIGEAAYNAFAALVEERDAKDKRWIKTRKTQESIRELNVSLSETQNGLYETIKEWYESHQQNPILGTYSRISFNGSVENMNRQLTNILDEIDKAEQAIKETREAFEKAKADVVKKNAEKEERKEKIADSIRKLGGDEFKQAKTEMPYASDRYYSNYDNIVNAAANVSRNELIGSIIEEAARHPELSLEELSQITADSLMEMKKKRSESQSSGAAITPSMTEPASVDKVGYTTPMFSSETTAATVGPNKPATGSGSTASGDSDTNAEGSATKSSGDGAKVSSGENVQGATVGQPVGRSR